MLLLFELNGVSAGESGSLRVRDQRRAFAAPAFEFQAGRDPTGEQRSAHAAKQIIRRDRFGCLRRATKMNLRLIFNNCPWERITRRLSWFHPDLQESMDETS